MKILIDLPDELSDKIYARKRLSTSEIYDLLGHLMNGVVIKDIRIGNNVYHADDLTFVTGMSIGDEPIPKHETWNNDNEACKYCGNNPNNGGSGVCHCTLAVPKIT